jgi:hypothetical protein
LREGSDSYGETNPPRSMVDPHDAEKHQRCLSPLQFDEERAISIAMTRVNSTPLDKPHPPLPDRDAQEKADFKLLKSLSPDGLAAILAQARAALDEERPCAKAS